MAYTKYSLTPANNNAAPPDGAPEGMLPSAVNDTMRDMMAQIRDVGDGIRDGTYTMTAAKITGGTITGITDLAVADGGTGASTAANARTNLGAAASGANSDITSLTGLTTALSATQGGTSQSTYATGDILYASASNTLAKLPAGTNGQVLTLASGVPSWAAASGGGFSGATINAASSSALTLTSSSTQYQVVQITSVANSVVNLPSATTMGTKGYPVFVIENAGLAGVPLVIKNNSGTIIGSIPVGSVAAIALEDNSTAAGVWSINTDVVDYSYTTNPNSVTSVTTSPASSGNNGIVGLSSTLFVRYWTTTVNGGTSASSTLYTQCVTISGNTLTIGSTQSKSLDSIATADIQSADIISDLGITRLSDSSFVVLQGSYRSYFNNPNTTNYAGASRNFFVCTVSGTTVTFGSSNNGGIPQSGNGTSLNSPSNGYRNGCVVRVADNSFCVVYADAVNNNTYPTGYSGSLACQTVTVSGTTLTVGTKATLGTSTYSQVHSVAPLSSTAILVAYGQASVGSTSGRTKLVVVSISGTTSTFNTEVTYESANVTCQSSGHLSANNAVAPSSGQAVFIASYFIGNSTITGTTPTFDMADPTLNVATGNMYLVSSSKAMLINFSTTGSPTWYLSIATGGFSKQQIVNYIPTSNSTNTYASNPGFGSPLGAMPTTSFAHLTADNSSLLLGTAL